jgi:succinylarginine dihydrolase
MRNGGGPACLRLRVALTDTQVKAAHRGVFFSQPLHDQLVAWVKKHYREELRPQDLADVHLLHESRAALDELTSILGLRSIYPFQIDSAR